MYCTKCHFGSEICKFPSIGEEKRRKDGSTFTAYLFRCPQCGCLDKSHLRTKPHGVQTRKNDRKTGD
jgi:hypothetical protein